MSVSASEFGMPAALSGKESASADACACRGIIARREGRMSAHISSIGSPRHSTAKWPPTYAACARVAGVRWARRRAAGRGALGVLGACAPHLLGAPILPPRHILGARRLLGLVREDRVLVAAGDERPRRPAHELLGDGLEAHRRVAAVAVVAAVLPRVLPQDARARQPERAALRRRQQPQPPAARVLDGHRRTSDHEAPLLVAARARRVARVRMAMRGRGGGRGG